MSRGMGKVLLIACTIAMLDGAALAERKDSTARQLLDIQVQRKSTLASLDLGVFAGVRGDRFDLLGMVGGHVAVARGGYCELLELAGQVQARRDLLTAAVDLEFCQLGRVGSIKSKSGTIAALFSMPHGLVGAFEYEVEPTLAARAGLPKSRYTHARLAPRFTMFRFERVSGAAVETAGLRVELDYFETRSPSSEEGTTYGFEGELVRVFARRNGRGPSRSVGFFDLGFRATANRPEVRIDYTEAVTLSDVRLGALGSLAVATGVSRAQIPDGDVSSGRTKKQVSPLAHLEWRLQVAGVQLELELDHDQYPLPRGSVLKESRGTLRITPSWLAGLRVSGFGASSTETTAEASGQRQITYGVSASYEQRVGSRLWATALVEWGRSHYALDRAEQPVIGRTARGLIGIKTSLEAGKRQSLSR